MYSKILEQVIVTLSGRYIGVYAYHVDQVPLYKQTIHSYNKKRQLQMCQINGVVKPGMRRLQASACLVS